MTKLDASVLINRPVEEVFSFVTDLEKITQWSAELLEVSKTSEGPVGVGTTFSTVARLLGQRMESDNEVTAYERNRTFESSVDGHTSVTFTVDAELGGFIKIAEPLVVRMMQRQFETDLATLKDLLVAQA